MCEHSSVSQAAALRREARRRKILENSTNRLKLIEGINSSSGKSSESIQESNVNHDVKKFECNVPEFPPKGNINETSEVMSKLSDSLKNFSNYSLQNDFQMDDEKEDEEETITKMFRDEERETQMPVFEFITEKKLHYIFLAFLVTLLLYLEAGFLFYENIFCPFFTVKAIEITKKQIKEPDLHPVMFLFMAGLPRKDG